MASLYKRADSPYFWISFLDTTGKRRCKSTGLRHSNVFESRKALDLCREMSSAEGDTGSYREGWDMWVPQFLEQRYENSPKSLQRYQTAWRNLRAFLAENNISIPRALTRQHVRSYVGWRSVAHDGVYVAGKNTALLEIKLLGLVVQEAVHNDFASSNPCHKLGVSRAASIPKPRISDAEHSVILKALNQEPEWMQTSYLIGWEQGCRFSETHLHIPSQVDLARQIIRFRTKGQKDTLAEFPMSPKLVPLFRNLVTQQRKWTYDMPRFPAQAWARFFRRIGLGHLCFHCTRISAITRMYEAGIPKDMVMRLAGHASYTAHQIYPRLTASGDTLQAMRQLLDRESEKACGSSSAENA